MRVRDPPLSTSEVAAMENFSEATLPSEEIVSCGEGDGGFEGQRIGRRHRVAAVLASERVARRSPAPRGSDDGTVATSAIRTKKSAEEGFFRRVTGRITTPRRVARSRSRAGTYVAGGAGLHVLHLELLLGGLLKF